MISLLTVKGELISRAEFFDEADLDAALARFDELSRPTPTLENAATRWLEGYLPHFADRDWVAMAEMLAEDICLDDRRRVINAGVVHGRDVEIASVRAIAEIGVENMTSTTIATRGERLVLHSVSFLAPNWPDEFNHEVIEVFEITDDGKASVHVVFDPDDFDSALAELDARYLAGEAAAHRHTWSVISREWAALNRGEIPPRTQDWVHVDHRLRATIDAQNLIGFLRVAWDQTPDLTNYVVTVHRLSDLGAVVTNASYGTSEDGFRVEWRMIELLTVEGDLMNRSELFDEADLDAALARFDELSRPEPRLDNAATRVIERVQASLTARDWDAIAEVMADDISDDDRRRAVNAGIRRGPQAEIDNLRAIADLGATITTSDVIATRGERLALVRIRLSIRNQEPSAFEFESLNIVEIDTDVRIAAIVTFDPDDFGSAVAEIEARYLAGEAASYADAWSVMAKAYEGLSRHELPSTTTGYVKVDHRRMSALAPTDPTTDIRAGWDLVPNVKFYLEAVHRLSDLGAVVTHAAFGTSHDGFDAEWRGIDLLTVEGDKVSRAELFDEADLDAALARFDELSRSVPRLENSATRVTERFEAALAAHDWDALAETMADDILTDDRRSVVNAGIRRGLEAQIDNMRAVFEFEATLTTSHVIATRGERLVLTRIGLSIRDREPGAFDLESLSVVEIDTDARIAAIVTFDQDNLSAAFDELDARYLAGEAAPYVQTWSVIMAGEAAVNRNEIPATTTDLETADHRRGPAFPPGELIAYVRAGWNLDRNINSYVETVHRLTHLGAVTTHVAYSSSQDGFDAEWRAIALLALEGELLSRAEIFDELDIDAALARFDELSQPKPRLENTASRMYVRFSAYLAARDWDAMAEMLADDLCDDDRRRVVSSGIQRGRDAQIANLRAIVDVGVTSIDLVIIATRGERLALARARVRGGDQQAEAFGLEILNLVEIDTDNRLTAGISFDVDDIDAAFEELDARYVAGEAAAHARTWSLITRAYAGFNRGELPASSQDWTNVDHRRVAAMAPGEGIEYFRASWELAAELNVHIESVHLLNDLGAVFTHVGKGTSRDGFEAEWRTVDIMTVDGDLISRGELFDEADLDAALARFGELLAQARRLNNTASVMDQRFWDVL